MTTATTSPVKRPTWSQFCPVALLLALGTGVRFSGLTRQSMWYDEVNGIRIATKPLAGIWTELGADVSPPLYYIVMHVWTALFGASELSAHVLPALFGALLPLAVYAAGSDMFNRRAGLIAGLVAALSPFHVYYSHEVRMYSMLALFGLLATWALHRAIRANRPRDWAWYVAWATAALYTHNYGAFLVLSGAVFAGGVLLRERDTRLLRTLLLAGAAIIVLYLPWLPMLVGKQIGSNAIASGWIPPLRPVHVWQTVVNFCSLYMFEPKPLLFWIGALPLLVAMGGVFVRRSPHGEGWRIALERPAVLALTYLGVTLGTPMLISLFKPIYLPFRYSIAAWPAFALLAGLGLSRIHHRWMFGALLGCHIAMASAGLYWHHRVQVKAQDREIAAYLAHAARPEDVILFSPHWLEVTLGYYQPDLPARLGYPFACLSERPSQSEAEMRDRRDPERLLDRAVGLARANGGRLWLVRGTMGWEPDSEGLRQLLDARFDCSDSRTAGYYQLNTYAVPPQ